uniref:Sec-independent protein translocase subunit TatA/TatB n=1 Tax=Prevotella sp. TaxID=59823 RepID=UPI004025B016
MFTSSLLMIGTSELLLVAGIALLLFGGKKLPELMKGMGEGVKSFKDAVNGNSDTQDKKDDKTDDIKENEKKEDNTNGNEA